MFQIHFIYVEPFLVRIQKVETTVNRTEGGSKEATRTLERGGRIPESGSRQIEQSNGESKIGHAKLFLLLEYFSKNCTTQLILS